MLLYSGRGDIDRNVSQNSTLENGQANPGTVHHKSEASRNVSKQNLNTIDVGPH